MWLEGIRGIRTVPLQSVQLSYLSPLTRGKNNFKGAYKEDSIVLSFPFSGTNGRICVLCILVGPCANLSSHLSFRIIRSTLNVAHGHTLVVLAQLKVWLSQQPLKGERAHFFHFSYHSSVRETIIACQLSVTRTQQSHSTFSVVYLERKVWASLRFCYFSNIDRNEIRF